MKLDELAMLLKSASEEIETNASLLKDLSKHFKTDDLSEEINQYLCSMYSSTHVWKDCVELTLHYHKYKCIYCNTIAYGKPNRWTEPKPNPTEKTICPAFKLQQLIK